VKDNVSVDINQRGKGIGKFLMNNIIKIAKKDNCKSIVLDVSNDNNIAVNLYKKSGFDIKKERKSILYKITIFKMIKNL